jgi:hypothetical protein
MKSTKITVAQNPDDVVEPVVLASAIRGISQGMTKLLAQGLNERAIVCLLHEFTGIGKGDIKRVVKGLQELEREYCKVHVSAITAK